jgi:hypothetical protein
MKTFSRSEVQAILAKASQLQHHQSQGAKEDGLNAAELIALGKDVGLSESAIEEAIQSVENDHQLDVDYQWINATSHLQWQQTLNIPFEALNKQEVLSSIRSHTGGIGKVTESDKAYEWEQRKKESGFWHIGFQKNSEGTTRLSVVQNWNGTKAGITVMGTVLPMALFVLLGKALGLGDFKAISALSGLATGFLGSRVYLKWYFKQQKSQFKQLLAQLRRSSKKATNVP